VKIQEEVLENEPETKGRFIETRQEKTNCGEV